MTTPRARLPWRQTAFTPDLLHFYRVRPATGPGEGAATISRHPTKLGAQGAEHRPDIDGLRAVAILPVLAFHTGIHAVRGGFVGVDVFFVISGYLITQVLLKDIHRGRFSLAAFYERRIRRILPALVVVLAATLVGGFVLCLPNELVDLCKSAIAAALSASNFYFWDIAGYFDSPTLTKPLLHTWSLAVEEQFYIFWPMCLFLACRWIPRHVLAATVCLAVVSLAVASVQAFTSPSASFYLVHARAWELSAGSVLALGIFPTPLSWLARNVLAAMGLGLIVFSCLGIDRTMPFPGLLAIPPCLGTAMIILAGRDGSSIVGKALALRPIAFVGLISYSLYLWHWPVVVLQRNYGMPINGGSDMLQKLTMIGCSLVLAILSWRLIEQPFRTGRLRPSRSTLFRIAGTSTAAVLALALVGYGFNGFPGRYSQHDLQIASFLNYDSIAMNRVGRCFLIDSSPGPFAPECLELDPSRPNYLLLGDSHAAQLWWGLETVYPEVHFLQATASNCFPTVRHGFGESGPCIHLLDGVLSDFLVQHRVDRVIIAARWSQNQLSRIEETLASLEQRHIPVTLVGPAVVYDSPLPRLILDASRSHDLRELDEHWNQSLRGLDDDLAGVAARDGAQYVSLLKALCSGASCLTRDDASMPLLFDSEHFTARGSLLVARRLRAQGLWAPARHLSPTSAPDRSGTP